MAANEPAVGQIGGGMGANGTKGTQLVANTGEQNGLTFYFHFVEGVGGDGSGRDIHPKKAIFICLRTKKREHNGKYDRLTVGLQVRLGLKLVDKLPTCPMAVLGLVQPLTVGSGLRFQGKPLRQYVCSG